MRATAVLIIGVLVVAGCSGGSSSASKPAAPSTLSHGSGVLVYLQAPSPVALVRANRDGSDPTTLPTPPHVAINDLDLSPDASRIAYTPQPAPASGGELHITDLAGTNQVTVPPTQGMSFNCVRWSPDGARLVLSVTDQAFTTTLGYAIVDAADGRQQSIPFTKPAKNLSCADWTSDGTAVVFAAGDDAAHGVIINQVWQVNIDGTALRKLGQLPGPCNINGPAVSPDGLLIALDPICPQGQENNNGVWVMDAHTGGVRQVIPTSPPPPSTAQSPQYWNPRWSKGNTSLIYGTTSIDPSGSPHASGVSQVDITTAVTTPITSARTINAAINPEP